jgi:hypothetical protein
VRRRNIEHSTYQHISDYVTYLFNLFFYKSEARELFDDICSKSWLAEGMLEHGYNDESWAYGHQLLDTAYNLARAREAAQSAQLGATNTVNRLYDSSWPHFQMLM